MNPKNQILANLGQGLHRILWRASKLFCRSSPGGFKESCIGVERLKGPFCCCSLWLFCGFRMALRVRAGNPGTQNPKMPGPACTSRTCAWKGTWTAPPHWPTWTSPVEGILKFASPSSYTPCTPHVPREPYNPRKKPKKSLNL